MRHNGYTSIGDVCIQVPNAFNLSDGSRFHPTKVFAEKGSRVPVRLGDIHDPVAGPIASVNTHFHHPSGGQVIAVDNGVKYWGRVYDPDQSVAEQIELVAIVALRGRDVEV